VLCEKYAIPHVSTGDILRNAVKAGSELEARTVASILEAGDLVSDDIVNQLGKNASKEADAQRAAVLLDGFPRTIGQAEALEAMLGDDGIKLCINLDVPIRTRHPAALVATSLSGVRHDLSRQ